LGNFLFQYRHACFGHNLLTIKKEAMSKVTVDFSNEAPDKKKDKKVTEPKKQGKEKKSEEDEDFDEDETGEEMNEEDEE